MVYPILQINQDNTSYVKIIDTGFDKGSVCEFHNMNKEQSTDSFLTLLKAFISQFNYGYDAGFDDAEELYCEDLDE